jgi:predicted nuclease of predicted toxin-antitoxin system
VQWVGDFLVDPGDEAIIRLAYNQKRVLITLDKDFGELAIFRGEPHCGIVRLVSFTAVGHGHTTVQILEKYAVELSQNAIITVEPF